MVDGVAVTGISNDLRMDEVEIATMRGWTWQCCGNKIVIGKVISRWALVALRMDADDFKDECQ